MPIYEYKCKSCGETFEARQKFSDPALNSCKVCGAADVTKLISQTAFSLKGGGWYQQGYGGSSKPAACPSGGGEGAGCGGCPKAANG
ncbi:FmdB family zinc ribbon protein [Geoalkalibacter halelectricus]|uniref:Zinc ribbon domain-containing protein n=1 Tax=Geoalkalibacter halelectricus TaxID=2847045 RepID=A0ABY5ZJZ7_9BACT|nr:zinc ribbon domain-containing protein [Geoalkalibacter halelectricus]MDO3380166.1 zinc ribbon domain-containing protein [Geoalkalibacter halelectricus]UWZ78260.1 zinc ribbon domain-containing protein [Geoalkalibacter halelectricus]